MKNKMSIKNLFVLIFFIFLCVLNVGIVSALEPKLVQCTMSDEYEEWLSMSEEERNSVMKPAYCDSDANKNTLSVMNITSKIDSIFDANMRATLPSKYDLRETEHVPVVKDQANTGGCWAFATTTILETIMSVKYGEDYVFSTRHIEYAATRGFNNSRINEYGYNRLPGDGGDYQMAASYMANGLGPVLESDMPFENNESVINISEIDKDVVVDVNNVVLNIGSGGVACTSSEQKDIKRYVYNYGAVAASTYMYLSSSYYNSTTGAYYYNGIKPINHAITIIGWDDSYSRYNFSSSNRPKSNGAWIVQNSYGNRNSVNGYNYISYEDVRVCDQILAVTDVDKDLNDNSYIYDKLGYNQFFGYELENNQGLNTAYAMNVFTKSSNETELLKEVTIGSNGTGTYRIYFMEGNGSQTSVSDMVLIGSGDLNHSGYVTHKFENPILLKKGVTDFSIAVYYSMDTSTMPIAVSVNDSSRYSYVSIGANKTFASSNGKTWSDLSNFGGYVVIASIKAFTDDVDYNFEIGKALVSLVDDNYVVYSDFSYSSNVDDSKIEFALLDEDDYSYTMPMIEYANGYIQLTIDTFYSGSRRLVVYYDGKYVGETKFILNNPLTSDVYKINEDYGYIYVPPKTGKNTFKVNIDGLLEPEKLGSTGYMYTGMEVENYTIIVLGDPSGDGEITPLDYIRVKNHIMGTEVITDPVIKTAADYNEDSNITPLDYVGIKNYIMKGE